MNIILRRRMWYIISGFLMLISILAIVVWGFNFGIDFKGGTLFELKFEGEIKTDQIKEVLGEYDLKSVSVQKTGESEVLIRTDELDDDKYNKIRTSISNKLGESEELRLETVGPTVGSDLKRKAIWAVLIASIVIIFYIAFAFRKVQKPASPWKFGVCAIIALVHDILIVCGIFAVLGHFYTSIVIDSLFITALLTILGFSVNDTIVVFDRVRENIQKFSGSNLSFEKIAGKSLSQTIVRSLNTSLTAILVLLAILLLGGQTIFSFVLALTIGFGIGTYSSIFVATPVLVSWTEFSEKREQDTRNK